MTISPASSRFQKITGCKTVSGFVFLMMTALMAAAGLSFAVVSTDTGQQLLDAGRNLFNPLVDGKVGGAHQYSAADVETEAEFFALSVSSKGSAEDVARRYRDHIEVGKERVSSDTSIDEWPSAVVSYSNAVSAISQLVDTDARFSDVEGFALVKSTPENYGEKLVYGGVIKSVDGHAVNSGTEDYEFGNLLRDTVEAHGAVLLDVQSIDGPVRSVRGVTDPFTGKGSLAYVNFVEEFNVDMLVREGSTGTSSGLIYALTMLDALSGGSDTGVKVAGTGAISFDGEVGVIGGLDVKLLAADFTGADVTFIPASQPEIADGLINFDDYSTRIVPVDTLAEAASVLCEEFNMETMCI